MSREIKFRAWDEEENMMLYDISTFTDDFTDMLNSTLEYMKEFSGLKLMQYTGLKDMNGSEIYEGDILEYRMNEDHKTQHLLVKWDSSMSSFVFGHIRSDYAIKNGRVIGNAYDI